jgi:glutaconate CoA-transferase subunit A
LKTIENTIPNKIIPLSQAISRFVPDGAHISIGGFTLNRNPMAAVYEIIRQQKKNLHLYAHSNGQGVDELIGCGCVARLEIAYAGTGRFAPTCIRFKKAVEKGWIEVEDYSNYHMTLRFMAGSMGVPFLPTRSGLGTDIVKKWGFEVSFREDNPKIPDKKLQVIDNPFGSWGETSKVVVVPAINPDVTILHVQKADSLGNIRIEGLPFADVVQAKAARRVIVTCENLVESDLLRNNSDRNQIPSFCVDAVVHLPWGAYPTACYNYYDYDPVYLNNYGKWAKYDESYREYLDRFIVQPEDHQKRIERAGNNRKEKITADPETGYATGLDRR